MLKYIKKWNKKNNDLNKIKQKIASKNNNHFLRQISSIINSLCLKTEKIFKIPQVLWKYLNSENKRCFVIILQ